MIRRLRARIVLIEAMVIGIALLLMGIILYELQKQNLIMQFLDDASQIYNLVQGSIYYGFNSAEGVVESFQNKTGMSMVQHIMLLDRLENVPENIKIKFQPKDMALITKDVDDCKDGFFHGSGMRFIKIYPMNISKTQCKSLLITSSNKYITGRLLLLMEIISAYMLFNFLILTAIGWFIIDRYTAAPLQALETAVQEISGGEYSEIKYMPHSKELANVIKAFNAMVRIIMSKEQILKNNLKELKETQQFAIKKERLAAIGNLASGISHEIGNPVSAIIAMLEILKNDDIKKDKRDMIQRSLNEAYRIDALVRQMLLYVRQASVNISDVNVKAVVNDALSAATLNRSMDGIDVFVDVNQSLTYRIDYEKLRHILINLISNALDAMYGKGRIVIRAGITADGISIEVSDTGEGIKADHLDKIFEPFFTTKPSGKGTGLGLSIVKNLVQDLDGDVTVKSEQGKGTTFIIRL